MRRIMKWTVKVNDEVQQIGVGKVLHVASPHGECDVVRVWTEEEYDDEGWNIFSADRPALVVATGRVAPERMKHLGTVIPASGGGDLVWHLYGGAQ